MWLESAGTYKYLINSLFTKIKPNDFVIVEDTNNIAYSGSTIPVGQVDYIYRISKYPITNAEYCLFLNAVDPNGINPNGIYDLQMNSSPRGGINFATSKPAGYFYSIKANMGDKPVNFISWFSAARFCNWLHNGAQTYRTTDSSASAPQNTGAYTLGTATSLSSAISPNAGARFRIPTLNEWIKAGYYKTGSTNAGYWTYPTQYDTEPQCIPNVTPSGYPIIFPLHSTYLHTDVMATPPSQFGSFISRLTTDIITLPISDFFIDSRLAADVFVVDKTWQQENAVFSRFACDICIGDSVFPTISIQSQPPAIIKQTSSSLTLSVSASVTQEQTLSYQWQKKEFGDSVFNNISGATSSSLVLTGLNSIDDDRDQYRCKISATGGAMDLFTSPTEIIFNTIITVNQQPTNVTITTSSGTASFSVSATTSPTTILWYQWEVAKPNDPTTFTLISSPQNLNSTLSLSGLTYENNNNDIYRCKLATEDNTGFIYSNTSTLSITPAVITITSQPVVNTKALNGNASVSVQASITMGGTLSFQWQRKPLNGTYANISGANSNTLSLTALTEASNTGDKYRCVINGTAGASEVISNESNLIFNTIVTITTQPSNVFSEDGNATFLCAATSDPVTPLYYIWQKAESSSPTVFVDISAVNNTNSTLSLTGLTFLNDNNDLYRCRVVTSDNTGEVISDTATLTLPDPSAIPTITITQQPKNTFVPAFNTKVAISGLASVSTGGTPIYTWEYLNTIANSVSDATLMTNSNWEPIVSNRLLIGFDSGISDSGDFGFGITNNNATINTSIKKYGNASLYCADGYITVTPPPPTYGPYSKFALNSDFTIEGWFYFNNNDTGYQPLICVHNGYEASGWIIILESNNTLSFSAVAGPDIYYGWNINISTTFIPLTSNWYHICVMRENRTIKMFVDGIEVASFSQVGWSEHRIVGGQLDIGGYQYFPDGNGLRTFNGYIDDIRIVHGKAIYNMSGFTKPQGPLTKFVDSVTSISKHFLYDLTVNDLDDINSLTQSSLSTPGRDKKIRLKVTYPGATTVYSNIIRYVFPVYGYYVFVGPQDSEGTPLTNNGSPETVNGVVYSVFDIPIGTDLQIGLYDDSSSFMAVVVADTLWYSDNGTDVTLEYSIDGINWTLSETGGFKHGTFGGNVILDIPTQNSSTSIYYRYRVFDTWPYQTNNGTDSTPVGSTYFYQILGGSINFKINWQIS